MELKQIYPSLTIQYTSIWMSAGMQRALRIAHSVPTAQAELRNAQCVSLKQWLFISYIPLTKQPFKLCFSFQHLTHRAVGRGDCPSSLRLSGFNLDKLGLGKVIATQRASFIPLTYTAKITGLFSCPQGNPPSRSQRSLSLYW